MYSSRTVIKMEKFISLLKRCWICVQHCHQNALIKWRLCGLSEYLVCVYQVAWEVNMLKYVYIILWIFLKVTQCYWLKKIFNKWKIYKTYHNNITITLTRRKESNTYLATVSRKITMKKDKLLRLSSADENHSAGWKLQQFIHFHCDLSTDSSQVGVALFPSC